MKKTIWGALVCAVALLSLQAAVCAQEDEQNNTPHLFFEQKIKEILRDINTHHKEYTKDKELLYRMVRDRIVRFVDTERVGKLILKRAWKSATEDQRRCFARVMTERLIRVHADKLLERNDIEITDNALYREARGSYRIVMSFKWYEMDNGEYETVPVTYFVSNGERGIWKIYEMQVDGISLTYAFYRKYKDRIQRRGIEKVIAELGKKFFQNKDANVFDCNV